MRPFRSGFRALVGLLLVLALASCAGSGSSFYDSYSAVTSSNLRRAEELSRQPTTTPYVGATSRPRTSQQRDTQARAQHYAWVEPGTCLSIENNDTFGAWVNSCSFGIHVKWYSFHDDSHCNPTGHSVFPCAVFVPALSRTSTRALDESVTGQSCPGDQYALAAREGDDGLVRCYE